MRNVLIATNFSPESRYTLEYVLDFLQPSRKESRILLVNTYLLNENSDSKQLVQINDELKKNSKELLDQEVAWAVSHCSNPLVIIESASHMGTLNNVILNLLKRESFDLVAMARGRGNHMKQVSPLLLEQNCPLLITYREGQRSV